MRVTAVLGHAGNCTLWRRVCTELFLANQDDLHFTYCTLRSPHFTRGQM